MRKTDTLPSAPPKEMANSQVEVRASASTVWRRPAATVAPRGRALTWCPPDILEELAGSPGTSFLRLFKRENPHESTNGRKHTLAGQITAGGDGSSVWRGTLSLRGGDRFTKIKPANRAERNGRVAACLYSLADLSSNARGSLFGG